MSDSGRGIVGDGWRHKGADAKVTGFQGHHRARVKTLVSGALVGRKAWQCSNRRIKLVYHFLKCVPGLQEDKASCAFDSAPTSCDYVNARRWKDIPSQLSMAVRTDTRQ
jgi:hypothetical protein